MKNKRYKYWFMTMYCINKMYCICGKKCNSYSVYMYNSIYYCGSECLGKAFKNSDSEKSKVDKELENKLKYLTV
jgi:hypothetical protein